MSSPLETPEFGHLYVGDTRDDDGQVIDSFLVEKDEAAALPQNSQRVKPLERPKALARLMTGTLVLDANAILAAVPIQIVPADPNRTNIRINGFSLNATPGATDYVSIADENGKAQYTTSSWRLRSGQGHSMDDATCAFWVYPAAGISTNNFEVTWIAVTS